MENKILTVNNLTKRYKTATSNAVDGVSFYVNEGSFFSLLGPNGAGKTTIIKILTTTLSKTQGEVMLNGYDIDKDSGMVRKNIGVIFQNPSLDINLSAEENIRFHTNLYGMYKYRPLFSMMNKEYRDKIMELSKLLGLEKDIFSPVKNLSGGMKRKLEIIRALMHEPRVLFLDEPTTGLDPISRRNLWSYLKNTMKEQKITIFLTTHYLEEAEDSDYICIINQGKLVSKGTPQEIKDTLVKNYIEVDTTNRIPLLSELTRKHIEFEIGRHVKLPVSNNNAIDIIKLIDTPLTHLKLHDPSLEEAYIRIIEP